MPQIQTQAQLLQARQAQDLRKAKRQALACLGVAALGFVATGIMPEHWVVALLEATFEAALVGGLADWFAVTALFRKVPLPIVGRHTAIIPKNKDRIANNLATFVRDKFFSTRSIASMVKRHDPMRQLSVWLLQPDNSRRLADYLARMIRNMLNFVEDAAVQRFIVQGVHRALDRIDLSSYLATILQGLTQDGRHQQLLNETIEQLARTLRQEEVQEVIANGIADWWRTEHPRAGRLLSSEWIGRNGAQIAVSALSRILDEVSQDPRHPLRDRFDSLVQRTIDRLETDEVYRAKAEEFKQYLKNDATFNAYLREIWGALRDWLQQDIAAEDSLVRRKIDEAAQWLGQALSEDEQLRRAFSRHLEITARGMAPDFADFLTRHIRDTVHNWDAQEMTRQIELNIGKDLQRIRINGTLVGGALGAVLFAVSQLTELVRPLF